MPYIIAEPCISVKDKACVEVCPVDCIYEGDQMLYIHPEECIDCGACEPVCPVKAIFAEDETPDQLEAVHRHQQGLVQGPPGGQAGDQELVALRPPVRPSTGSEGRHREVTPLVRSGAR